jgi:hypothetical protein
VAATKPQLRTLALLGTLCLTGASAAAHDIPVDVTVQMFAKAQGRLLRLVVRAPLEAMRDIDYPKRGRQTPIAASGLSRKPREQEWGPASNEYVDLARVDRALREAAQVWLIQGLDVYENDSALEHPRLAAVRVSWLGDRSFTSYENALAHVTGPPLPPASDLFWNQGLLDAVLEYDIGSDRSALAIQPRLGRLGNRVTIALRYEVNGSNERAFELTGDPGLVSLDPTWHQAVWRFVVLGFRHILDGPDHLLFLLCLIIPVRRLRPLVLVITAFTVAHSLTLIASAYDLGPGGLWFPPLVEALIAASIVFVALANIAGAASRRVMSIDARWLVAFGFGLIHGFGFSFALRQSFQFAGSHLLASLLSFNIGVEIGQLLVLAFMIPLLNGLFRFVVAERVGTLLLSAIVAHTAWHWMTDRVDRLRHFPWPALGANELAGVVRGLMWLVALGAAFWLAALVRRSLKADGAVQVSSD